MFSEGTGTVPPPRPRPWPPKIHLPWLASPGVLSNRLAKMFSAPKPVPLVSSYHVAHGTVRPAPAKSIAGASPSCPSSKFSEPGNVGDALERPPTVPAPRVVHAPAANDRENTWSLAGLASPWRKIDHGTATFPAVRAPPTTSAFVGSSPLTLSAGLIPDAMPSLTWLPGGSGWNALAVPAAASAATVAATATLRRLSLRHWIRIGAPYASF
jgi:hypothetical protein